jgi:shikimate dehydrogenase
MDVSGKTKILGIFGYPVEHSLSPNMHNTAFDLLGMDMCYVAYKVAPEDLPAAVASIRALNMLGVNTTVPHKENVIPLLDEVDKEASFIGAVNTVVNKDGRLTGYNTDGRGFMASLDEECVDVTGKRVIVIGTGGASRAISYYLSEKASSLSLFDIDSAKAKGLVDDLKKIRNNVSLLFDLKNIKDADIIINATPLGLKPEDPIPFDTSAITPYMVICDLIYKETPLLKEAETKGAKAINGSGMLLWQGVLAFELWTGVKPPVEDMRQVLLANIK